MKEETKIFNGSLWFEVNKKEQTEEVLMGFIEYFDHTIRSTFDNSEYLENHDKPNATVNDLPFLDFDEIERSSLVRGDKVHFHTHSVEDTGHSLSTLMSAYRTIERPTTIEVIDGLILNARYHELWITDREPHIKEVFRSYEAKMDSHKNFYIVEKESNSMAIENNADEVFLVSNLYCADTYTEDGVYQLMSLIRERYDADELPNSKVMHKVAELIRRGLYEDCSGDDRLNIYIFDLLAYFKNIEEQQSIIGRENIINFFEEVAEGILRVALQKGSLRA